MEKLKNRDYYLNQLISFKDTSSIKIVTGIRRCGKSKLLDLMINYLLSVGIKKEQIIKINFESLKFSDMTYSEVYDYIISKSYKEGKTYIFLDEPQLIDGWEKVVNSLREDIDSDIYITGSNSHMLSSEYSTLLSGRYVEIKMLPLSFKEFLDFRGFTTTKEINALGINETRCYYKDNSIYDINDLFDAYLKHGECHRKRNFHIVRQRKVIAKHTHAVGMTDYGTDTDFQILLGRGLQNGNKKEAFS